MHPRQKRLFLAKFFRHRTSIGNLSDIGGRRTLRSFSEEGHKASADSTEYFKPIRADKYLRSCAYINYKNRTRVQKRDAFIILGVSFLCLIFFLGVSLYFFSYIYNAHENNFGSTASEKIINQEVKIKAIGETA